MCLAIRMSVFLLLLLLLLGALFVAVVEQRAVCSLKFRWVRAGVLSEPNSSEGEITSAEINVSIGNETSNWFVAWMAGQPTQRLTTTNQYSHLSLSLSLFFYPFLFLSNSRYHWHLHSQTLERL